MHTPLPSSPSVIAALARSHAQTLRDIATKTRMQVELSKDDMAALVVTATSLESIATRLAPNTPTPFSGHALVPVGSHFDNPHVMAILTKLVPAVIDALDAGETVLRYSQEFGAGMPSVLVSGRTPWPRSLPSQKPDQNIGGRVLHAAELHGASVEWIGYNFAEVEA